MTAPCIAGARMALARAEARLHAVVAQTQATCDHKEVAEADYKSLGSDSGALPPVRICLHCCMTEDGWGPGYIVLKAKRWTTISREDVYSLREGLMITDSHKGPLLRREVTVAELIKSGGVLPREDDNG